MDNIVSNKKFHDLNKIEIPLLQRDYAHGRPSEIKKLESFLNDIESVKNKNTMSLNFIYGYEINESDNSDNSDNSDKKRFVPIDGQQRLTLLFLLHVYADKDKPIFSYKMRPSAESFIKELKKNKLPEGKKEENDNRSLKEEIEKQSWFLPQWKKDPTIKSMLIVLDEIDKKFYNTKDGLKDSLGKIEFKYLNITSLDQDDNLYLKLNARGVPLSEFENIRAILIKLSRNCNDENFKKKLDNEWAKLFWDIAFSHKDKENNKNVTVNTLFDTIFLNFIKNILVNESFNNKDSGQNNSDKNTKKSQKDIFNSLDLSSSYNSNCILPISKTLDAFKCMWESVNDRNEFENEYHYFYKLEVVS